MKKKKISVSAAKAKGRKLQNEICARFSELCGLPYGKDKDIESRPMGQSGTDVRFSGKAKHLFPYSIECKYQETWSLPAWIKQARSNQEEGTEWLLFFRRNHFKPVVAMDADFFFKLLDMALKKRPKLKLKNKGDSK